MDTFVYIVVLCLVILVCALIHELSKAKDDIADLEYEVTQQKLEYRREIKNLKEEKIIYNNYKVLLDDNKIPEKDFDTWIAKCVEDIKNV